MIELVAGHNLPADPQGVLSRVPLDANAPATRCILAAESLFLESGSEFHAIFPNDTFPDAQHSQTQAIAFIPVRQRDQVVGTLGMRFTEARRFSSLDRAFFQSLADLCGQAMHRAALYEAERRAKDDALAANRVKDEFLATLSHELRTPLQSILGWARLLRTGMDAAAIPRAIQSIDRNARAQARLIGDILDVSRIVAGRLRIQPRVTTVESFVTAAVDTLRPLAESKSIAIVTRLENLPSAFVGDPDRLQQVVWNLVANAVKFTPDGGTVEVLATTENERVEIHVADSGMGIEQSFLPLVFDPFRQAQAGTTRTHGGLGLGLAIVRHLVELHGGTVTAESGGTDLGSTFAVRLPIPAITPATESAFDASTTDLTTILDPACLDGMRVLVVDDHEDARTLIGAALERFGAESFMATSGDEALEQLPAIRPHVIVSDIGMPRMDGYELLRRIRALGDHDPLSSTPAVALTAYARDAERVHALEAGFQAHLSKPVDPQVLAQHVASLRPARLA